MVNFKDLTLLILTPDFPDEDNRYIGAVYVKNQIELLKPYFKRINVICPVLSSYKYMSNDRYCNNYQYDNVFIYYPRCVFIPRLIPIVPNKVKIYFDFRLDAIIQCMHDNHLRFDLIHSHFTYPTSYCAYLLNRLYNIPYIMTINEDSGWLNDEIQSNNNIFINIWKSASNLIVINSSDSSKLKIYNKNTNIIPYSVNQMFFPKSKSYCRDYLGIPQNIKMLFTIGIIQRRKGYDYLIRSLIDVCNEYPDIRCYIGGNYELEKAYGESLKKLVTILKLDKNIYFTGFIHTSELPLWMNACDLYVSSSLEEGFGITQIEALSCGKPVIATKTAGSLDIITNDNGILCERANSINLSNAILSGFQNDWDTSLILKSVTKYNYNNILKKLLNTYREVLDDR